jgi:hypothetical protein
VNDENGDMPGDIHNFKYVEELLYSFIALHSVRDIGR